MDIWAGGFCALPLCRVLQGPGATADRGIHENDKKWLYSRRVLDVEHGSFMPLVFTTTVGMRKEYSRYHSRLAELIATKKRENYSQTIPYIRARTSFALFWSTLVLLRGSRVNAVLCLTTTVVILKSLLPKEPLTLLSVS